MIRLFKWSAESVARSLACVALFSFCVMLPALWLGHIVGHSSVLNASWAQGFAQALSGGAFYPRWLPEMTGGAGSPVFYFYGPLPFYVAAPFAWASGNGMMAVVWAEAVLLAASGVAAFLFLRLFARRELALAGALLYAVLPYHFAFDIWYRAAFGEQAAFVFLPLAWLCILRLKDDGRFAIGLAFAFAGQLFSHLPTALLFAPILAFLSLWEAWHQRSWRVLLLAKLGGAGGLALATLYLWPALALQGLIQPAFWRVENAGDNLFFSAKAVQDFSLFLLPQALVVLLVLLLVWKVFRAGAAGLALRPFAWICAGILVFCSVLAGPFWAHAGLFGVVQFPWRLFSALDLGFVTLMVGALQLRLAPTRLVAGVAVLAVLGGWAVAGFTQYLFYHLPDDPTLMTIAQDRAKIALHTDAAEYLPACFALPEAERHAMTDALAQRNQAALRVPGRLNVYFFPFLQVESHGQSVATACDEASGFITFDAALSEGPFTIVPQATAVERRGALVSGTALLLLLAALAFATWRAGQKPASP